MYIYIQFSLELEKKGGGEICSSSKLDSRILEREKKKRKEKKIEGKANRERKERWIADEENKRDEIKGEDSVV